MRYTILSLPPFFLCTIFALQGHFGVCQVVKAPEIRRVLFHIELDVAKRMVRLHSVACVWEDPINYPPSIINNEEYELELLLPGGRSLPAPLSSLSTSEPSERPNKGVVRTAIYTNEDAIGYRVWNHFTGELLGEEMFSLPKSPPKIEVSGNMSHGISVKSDQKATTINVLLSNDQGLTWHPFSATGTTNQVTIPSRDLLSKSATSGAGVLVEVRVMVGLKLFRERFRLDSAGEVLQQGAWKHLEGQHPPIPQSALAIATHEKEK